MTALFEDDVVAPLTGFAQLPDWLAACMTPERVATSLRTHVPELSDGRCSLLACLPQRLRAKGEEWLARYSLRVRMQDGAERTIVLVGNLCPPGRSVAVATQGSATAVLGDDGWRCWLPDLRLDLRLQVADEGLPSLPALVEPDAARVMVQDVLHRAGYANATVAACTPDVVRYKPGSRCTVVTHLQYANGAVGPNPVVVKTHQGDKGSTAWEAMRALWQTSLTAGEHVTLAEPLGYLPTERILVQGPVPGRQTLKELARETITDGGKDALGRLRIELDTTARALAALHGCGARYGRVATFEEEVDEVEEVVGRLASSVPALGPAARPLLDRMRQLDGALPSDPAVCAHHDFRPAQVMLHEGRVGFIDFDGSCMAEPALDLGRFRAKLRDIGVSALVASGRPLAGAPLTDNIALLDDLCEQFLATYQQHAVVSRDRVLLWESCDLVTAMLHAWTKVRLARIGPRLTVLEHHLRDVRGETLAVSPLATAAR